MINKTYKRLIQLAQKLEEEGLDDSALDIEKLKKLTRDDEEKEEENQRPLYDAHTTGIPGTWAEPDGELIKTSKD